MRYKDAQLAYCTSLILLPATLMAQPMAGMLKIQDATAVRLSLMESLNSATNNVDDPVRFEVTEDVNVGGTVAIPRGSTAVGHIVEVEPKRRLGRAGKLNFSVDHVKAPDGVNVRLRASSTRKGDDKTGTVIVGTVLLSPLFLIMRGKDVSIPRGTQVIAYVDGDREITMPGIAAGNTAPAIASAVISGTALTNADIVKLRDAGLGDQLMIAKIRATRADYRLETNDIIELKRAGLSEAVIGVMLDAQQQGSTVSQPSPAITAPLATPAQDASPHGLVDTQFRSTPPGAFVSISGMGVCYTPCVTKLEAKQFRVTMKLSGYADWTREVTVEAGKPVVAEMRR